MSVFIPKQYKKEQVTVRMRFDELDQIDQLASRFGLSRSELINQCIVYALDHMPIAQGEEFPVAWSSCPDRETEK